MLTTGIASLSGSLPTHGGTKGSGAPGQFVAVDLS